MKYPEFITAISDRVEQGQVLRALGRTVSFASFEFSDPSHSPVVLPSPLIAVLSTDEPSPQERTYNVLATTVAVGSDRQYPLVKCIAAIRPPLFKRGFDGKLDEEVGVTYTELLVDPKSDVFKYPLSVGYVEGNSDTLMVEGQPTFPQAMCEVQYELL